MTFHAGQKVVCINAHMAGPFRQFSPDEAPRVGGIYTVRRAFIGADGLEVLWLDEIARSAESILYWNDPDLGYGAFRFRPLTEHKKKTDISFALDILDRVSGKIKEPV